MINGNYRYHPIFQEVTDAEYTFISPLMSQKTIYEGSAVYLENMPGEALYIIKNGSIRISKMLGEGEEKILVVLGPGDFFGEMALLDGSARAATARVLEQAELVILRKTDFENLALSNPTVALKLIKNIVRCFCRKFHDSNQEVKDFFLGSLK